MRPSYSQLDMPQTLLGKTFRDFRVSIAETNEGVSSPRIRIEGRIFEFNNVSNAEKN